MKKTIILLFVTISAFLAFGIEAFAYSDVSSNHKYYEGITYLESMGLLPNDSNLFKPDDVITIKDFYPILLTFGQANIVNSNEVDLPYEDVSNSATYSKYIQTAINLNILKPLLRDPKLYPDRSVRKRQVIELLFDTLGVGVNKLFDKSDYPFTDLDVNGSTAPYLYEAYQLGLYETNNPFLAKAARQMTKGEVANILYMLELTDDSGGTIIVEIDNGSSKSEIDNPAFDVFVEVWETIQDEYYFQNEIDETEMLYNAINGVVNYLEDPYTVFTTPDELNSAQSLSTEYEGVGMSVEIIDEVVTVITPFKGSPAEEAGVEPNDIILEVDGEDVDGLSLESVVNMIKGPTGTEVELTIKRDSKTLEIDITRGYIFYKTASIEYLEYDTGTIAHINLLSFADDSVEDFLEVAQSIHDTQAAEGNIKGIVLDLRNNPGGYLDVAIEIGGFFFDGDTNMVMLENNNEDRTMYYAEYYGAENEYKYGSGLLSDYEMIVLVNDGSASASEILAGAFQDHNRAEIFGEQSFGKGTVQELLFYNDGSVFKLTVSKWLTPDGNDINKVGVTPDQVVTNSSTTDSQLDTAVEEILY
jgi:carboxyl-terminal processing protease